MSKKSEEGAREGRPYTHSQLACKGPLGLPARTPKEIYFSLDLGPGGYALGPAQESEETLVRLLKQEHLNRLSAPALGRAHPKRNAVS